MLVLHVVRLLEALKMVDSGDLNYIVRGGNNRSKSVPMRATTLTTYTHAAARSLSRAHSSSPSGPTTLQAAWQWLTTYSVATLTFFHTHLILQTSRCAWVNLNVDVEREPERKGPQREHAKTQSDTE